VSRILRSKYLSTAVVVLLTWANARSQSIEKEEIITTALTIPSETGLINAFAYRASYRVRWESNEITHLAGLFVAVPSKGLFWIGNPVDRHVYEEKFVDRKFFAFKDKLVGVSTTDILMFFYISAKRLASSNLAKTAVETLDARVRQDPRVFDTQAVPVAVAGILGAFEPFGRSDPMRGGPAPEIAEIAVGNDKFSITLRGGEKDDIEATITFGDDFRVISATYKGKQVYPKAASSSRMR
jgi:hypothetical protein